MCKIYRKATSMKELEQRAAAMEVAPSHNCESVTESWPDWPIDESFQLKSMEFLEDVIVMGCREAAEEAVAAVASPVVLVDEEEEVDASTAASRKPSLPELEVPKPNGLEWLQDPFLTQLRSPWMVELCSPSYATILNF